MVEAGGGGRRTTCCVGGLGHEREEDRRRRVEEEEDDDLPGRFGVVCDRRRGDVDCSLRLGLPGTGVAAGAVSDVEVAPMQRITSTDPPALGYSSHAQQTSFVVSELCTMCATTHTPLWRSGPFGPKVRTFSET